jgi:hypothetical protein
MGRVAVRGVGGWLLASGLWLALAHQSAAQGSGDVVAADPRIQSLDRLQAEQERLRALTARAPKAYQDNFMSTAEVQAAEAEDAPSAEAAQGLRTWMLESRMGLGESTGMGSRRRRASEFGLRAEYRQETLNYGEFLLQADGRHYGGDNDTSGPYSIGSLGYAEKPSSGRFTLRNLGLPITAQTFADTAVGDVSSEITDGLSRNYRLSLGASALRGASTRLFSPDLDLRAGFGERGYLAGGPYPGFERSRGSLGWLGLTRRLDDKWFVAAQFDRASEVPAYYDSVFTPQGIGAKDVASWAASVGYGSGMLRDGDSRVRATLVGSRVRSTTPGVQTGDARGLFVEASVRSGRYRHEVGAYSASPNLHFGDYELGTGTRGAWWRLDYSDSRLNWGASLDHEGYASDLHFNGVGHVRSGASGNVQYQYDNKTSFGANLNVHQTRYDGIGAYAALAGISRSFYGNAFVQTRLLDLPRSRMSLTMRRNEAIVLGGDTATGQEAQWEQDWIGGRYETTRPELTTTLGYARDESGGSRRDYPTAGVQLRYWIDSGFNVSAHLRYTSERGGLYTSRGLSGTLTAEKELGHGWRTGLIASLNQARADALQTSWSGPQVYRSSDKTAYVYLRWEGNAGTPFQTAGARGTGAGAGSVAGRVYLDANRDGEPQADERGAAQIEVVLDGRYRTTTDHDGRFEFPLVTTGRHQLTLTLESVPLPWGSAPESGVSVDVPLRGQAAISIPLIKVGE